MNRIILFLIITFNACVFAVPGELLRNGSFEYGDVENPWNEGHPPYSWSNWTDDGGWAAWKYSSTSEIPAHTGTKYVVCGGSGGGALGGWHQNIIASEGTSYIFNVWARTEGWHSAPEAEMLVDFKNSSGTIILTDEHTIFSGTKPNPNVWTNYSMTSSPTPAEAAIVSFAVRGDMGSPIFDDASVVIADTGADFNYNKKIDKTDFAKLSKRWQKSLGQTGYTEIYDLDGNGIIDIDDLQLFAEQWLWHDTPVVVNVNDDVHYQIIDGFGASFTDSSAWIVHEFLDTADYLALMEDIFDPATGAGLSYLRQPMGTSDMRRKPDYTYNEVPGDYAMNHFSIAEDQDYIIPVLQKALEINPDIKIMGSPWTAPSWMKSGEWTKYQGGWLTNNDLTYNAYADYFVKYIQAYAAQGIPINAITLQNEPLLQIGYPSMFMSASDQIQLIEKLGPKFASAGITTKIIAYDHNWDNTTHALEILADPEANSYLNGIAWHHYGGDVSSQTIVHDAYPTKGTYFTEGAIGEWMHSEGDFDGVLFSSANLLIKTTRNWAKCVVLWNMVLHELYNGPVNGQGCDTCFGVISVNSVTREITKNGSYYGLGHASKFLRNGAKRIESTDTSWSAIKNVAFVNTDDSVVVFALNEASDTRNFQIDWNGQSLIYPLEGRSLTSFVWPDQPNADVQVWVTTGDQAKLLTREPDIQF